MSPRAVSRRAHLLWLAPKECEPPAGADRCIWLVGKQSTISNRNTSRSISIFAELSSCFGLSHRFGSLPGPPQQDAHLGRLLCAGQIRSVELCPLKSNCNTAPVRSIRNPFSCNDFSRSVRDTALTKRSSEQNITPYIARSRCAASAELPTAWVPAPLAKSGED